MEPRSRSDDPDLSDVRLYKDGDPVATWAQLRLSRSPYWNRRPGFRGFWAVLTYEEGITILKDNRGFNSRHGMRLDADPSAVEVAANRLMIVSDPPRHAQIRSLIGSQFTPRAVARLKDSMRHVVRTEIAPALAGQPVDFTDVAAALPVAVVCDLLGVPARDRAFMLSRTRRAFGESNVAPVQRLEAHAEIIEYYSDLVEFRRRHGGDDVLSALVQGSVDGVPLTDEEIFLNCDGLVSGGNETTRHAAVGGLLALAERPWAWPTETDPQTIDALVDEILRFTSPAMHVLRTAEKEHEFGGETIRRGDQVAVWLPSMNRDESTFAMPDTFNPRRQPNPHVALGVGAHVCLGSALARLELSVLFDELLRAASGAALTGPVVRLASNLIRGFESLPVSLHSRSVG